MDIMSANLKRLQEQHDLCKATESKARAALKQAWEDEEKAKGAAVEITARRLEIGDFEEGRQKLEEREQELVERRPTLSKQT